MQNTKEWKRTHQTFSKRSAIQNTKKIQQDFDNMKLLVHIQLYKIQKNESDCTKAAGSEKLLNSFKIKLTQNIIYSFKQSKTPLKTNNDDDRKNSYN